MNKRRGVNHPPRVVKDAVIERDGATAKSDQCSIELRRPETVWWNTRPGLTLNRNGLDWRAEMHSTRQCSVDGCDHSDIQARGMCRMHYFRWYRTGSTDVRRPQRAARGICIADGCEKVDTGKRGLCAMHRAREIRHGDVHAVHSPRVYRGSDHPWWTGDDATYQAMHQRVRKARGNAAQHICVDCGAPALHWSYDRNDPDERTDVEGPYSVKIEHYEPRCVPCHKRFDLGAHRASA